MPTYEYVCESCKQEFAVVQSVRDHDAQSVRCPGCQSENVRQVVSAFTAQTSRKS